MRDVGTSDHWGTPAWLVEIARRVLGGGIDLDPCSSDADNLVVRAKTYYTEEEDGLAREWPLGCSVLCNPPGGRSKLVKAFWDKCEKHDGPVFWIGFNLGQLRYLSPSPMHQYAWAILSKRVAFRDPGLIGRVSPRYDNYVALTGRADCEMAEAFREELVTLCSACG